MYNPSVLIRTNSLAIRCQFISWHTSLDENAMLSLSTKAEYVDIAWWTLGHSTQHIAVVFIYMRSQKSYQISPYYLTRYNVPFG